MLQKITTPAIRQWFYTVAAALLAVLVFYNIVSADSVPLWLSLIAAIGAVSNTQAAVVTSQQRKDGTLNR